MLKADKITGMGNSAIAARVNKMYSMISSLKCFLCALLYIICSSLAFSSAAQVVLDSQSERNLITVPSAAGAPQINLNGIGSGLPSGLGSITNTNRGIQQRGLQGVPQGLQQGGQGGSAFFVQSPEHRSRTEFQEFILQSSGRQLPIFGADLFRQSPSTFAPVDNIPVMPDYVVGPGDEIVIRAWGQIDVDYSAVISRDGTISIPKVGVLNLSGIKYQDLNGYLKAAFGRVFRNFELTASLGALRSIQIFVVGQAKFPGTYTVSSLSTLVTALFATGGPSVRGSLRSIQLKRGNKVVTELDLYDLLVTGDKSKDATLLPGDVIFIPPAGQLAAITGSVNIPAIYELKRNAPLSDLIRWAGGLSTTAQGQKVTVDRIEDRKTRKVEEFSLDNTGLAQVVRDGDLVTVFALTPRFDNAVTLRGNVAQPSRISWRQGMRVRDVIPDREALISREYWLKRNQIVGLDENISRLLSQQQTVGTSLGIGDLLQRRDDDARDLTIAEAVRRRQIENDANRLVDPVRAVANANISNNPNPNNPIANNPNSSFSLQNFEPGRQNSSDPTRLLNQIRPSLKEINWEYALIERIRPIDLTTSLIPFNLGKAIQDNDPQHNLLLEPGDILTIFSREDIQVPAAKQTKYIRLEGEFNGAGVYQIQPGETLRQLMNRVGGSSRQAYLFGSVFTRESTRLQQQKSLEGSLNRLERDIQRASNTRVQNSVSAEDPATIKQQTDSQQALVDRLRQIRPTGRIVLSLPENAELRDLPDLPLEDGDRFYVPSAPSMVTVMGAVYNENAFVFRPANRVADYLAQAGGPTKDADKGSTYVLRADGSVLSARQTGLFGGLLAGGVNNKVLMPGDSVIVPEELDKTGLMRSLKDIAQLFYQFGLGAAALKVLKD